MGGKGKGKKGGGSSAASGGDGDLVQVDPRNVRFTHSRIRPLFSCGRRVMDTLQELRDHKLKAQDLPTLTVMYGGEDSAGHPAYFSLNNRRLFVFKRCREEGLLPGNTIGVRVKPAGESRRLKDKYTLEKCSNTARLMPEKGHRHDAEDLGTEEEHGSEDEHDKEEDEEGEEEDEEDRRHDRRHAKKGGGKRGGGAGAHDDGHKGDHHHKAAETTHGGRKAAHDDHKAAHGDHKAAATGRKGAHDDHKGAHDGHKAAPTAHGDHKAPHDDRKAHGGKAASAKPGSGAGRKASAAHDRDAHHKAHKAAAAAAHDDDDDDDDDDLEVSDDARSNEKKQQLGSHKKNKGRKPKRGDKRHERWPGESDEEGGFDLGGL